MASPHTSDSGSANKLKEAQLNYSLRAMKRSQNSHQSSGKKVSQSMNSIPQIDEGYQAK